MVAALYNYQPCLAQILGFWAPHADSKCFHYIIVDADSHLILLPPSILDMYKVFENIAMLSIDIYSSSLKQFYTQY
jgi:hypothetical protein